MMHLYYKHVREKKIQYNNRIEMVKVKHLFKTNVKSDINGFIITLNSSRNFGENLNRRSRHEFNIFHIINTI